ncbi:MAG TPA: DUF805 domain-containing protein [Rhizomicrobium sp.]|jgi:uncharacterized membrane protein YhaH (DUF805 family)|nr:DUF805 domain-containing protein [Rhizomicrobium sp.]
MDLNAIVENFKDTITNHYFDMKGRVGRERFWYFVLACVVVQLAAGIVQRIIFLLPISALVSLALLLPMAGMGARRLQDIGRNGSLVWIGVIPAALYALFAVLLIGPFGILGAVAFAFTIGPLLGLASLIAAIVLIYYWCQPGDAGPNAFGASPASAQA